MSEGIVIATIGAIGAIIAAGFGFLGKWLEHQKRKQAEREIAAEADGLDVTKMIPKFDALVQELQKLMLKTPIDRFLILKAWNGRLDPRWTTAIFQYRTGAGGEPVSDVHFELDDDYLHRLQETVNTGSQYLTVREIPDSAIRRIYEAEGVSGAYWSHIRTGVKDDGSAEIFYCSFATHDADGLDQKTRTHCDLLVGFLLEMFQTHDRHDS